MADFQQQKKVKNTNRENQLQKKPYLQRIEKDPWGNQYHYLCPGKPNKNSYDLWSYGSDDQIGGNENHSKNITNWDY